MKSWYRLNVSTEGALKIDVPQFCLNNTERAGVYLPGKGGIWTFGKDEIFNQSWINNLQESIPHIEVTGALVFYREQGYQHPIAHLDLAHKDSPSARDIEYEDNGFRDAVCSGDSMSKQDFYPVVSAYNFTLDPQDDSEMTWFERKRTIATELKNHKGTNDQDVPYQDVPLENLNETESVTIGSSNLVMVRVNKLHNVRIGARERWCVSLRAVMGWKNWEQAVNTLEPWIVE